MPNCQGKLWIIWLVDHVLNEASAQLMEDQVLGKNTWEK